MSIVGRTYLERGAPVTVLRQWREAKRNDITELTEWQVEKLHLLLDAGLYPKRRTGPRNVLVRRADGSLVVRPFRGLRKLSADADTCDEGRA